MKRNTCLLLVLVTWMMLVVSKKTLSQGSILDEPTVFQNHPARPVAVWPYAKRAVYPGGKFVIKSDNGGLINFDTTLARSFQRAIDSVRFVFNTKGISAAVLIPEQGLWQGVCGMSTSQDSISPDMLFCIGSNTKTFMSTIMLKLAEENRLSLDDSVGRWLPPMPNIAGGATIRQLLNMTSGFFDYFNDSQAAMDSVYANPNRYWSPEEIVASFVGPPHRPPGGAWEYCNTDLILAGMMIRNIMQSTVSAQLRQRILTPLILGRTYFPMEEPLVAPIAHPWYNGSDVLSLYGPALLSMAWTAGAMFSTSENLARWSQALYGGQVLTPSSLGQMLTLVPYQVSLTGGFRRDGYGLSVIRLLYFGKPMWAHSGHLHGYLTEVAYFPQTGASFVVLLNQSPDGPLYEALSALMHEYLKTFTTNPASPTIVYAVSGNGGAYSVDTSTASTTSIGPYRYANIVGCRVDPRTHQLVGLAPVFGGYEFVRIDGVTGEAFPCKTISFVTPPSEVKGMTFKADGTLYIGSTDGRLFSVDMNTAVATQVAVPGIPIAGLDFNPVTGQLWASVKAGLVLKDRIYKINLPSGDTILVGRTGYNLQTNDIKFDRYGNLYGIIAASGTHRLAKIDTGTGVGTEIGSLGISSVNALAFWPDSVTVGMPISYTDLKPMRFVLEQNYPNPFNPSTKIVYRVASREFVELGVYDILGRKVATLVNEVKQSGTYTVQWDADGVAGGAYFYRLRAGDFVAAKKFLLLR